MKAPFISQETMRVNRHARSEDSLCDPNPQMSQMDSAIDFFSEEEIPRSRVALLLKHFAPITDDRKLANCLSLERSVAADPRHEGEGHEGEALVGGEAFAVDASMIVADAHRPAG